MEKYKKSLKIGLWIILLLIPLTLIIGALFEDELYGIISLIIIILSMAPLCTIFERRKPRAREIVPIAVMVSIASIGRIAFAMLPQFKPVSAIVIITGMAFGAEAGFLTGALSALVSNFFFGQGPWTPWQMFAFGIIGFLSGILYNKSILKGKLSICTFGLISGYLYGLIVNLWNILTYLTPITLGGVLLTYTSSFYFDTIHAVSTVIFLYIMEEPMMEKMVRLKKKYGLFIDK